MGIGNFGGSTQNVSAWARAVMAHMPPGTTMTISFDTRSLNKLLKKAASLKRNKNRIVTAAMRAGLRVTAKTIKQDLPAYTTKYIAARRRANPGRSIAGQSKLKEAKRAVGVLSRVSKGGRGPVPKGEVEGKVGSNVGMGKRTSASRPGGSKGIGRGNLHWYLMGTKPRFTDRTGIYTGKMRTTMVVSRAWGATKGLVLAKMKRNLAAGIKREAAKS